MAIDNMYELEATGELLEQKGVMNKDEIIIMAKDLKQKNTPTESRTAATSAPLRYISAFSLPPNLTSFLLITKFCIVRCSSFFRLTVAH